MHVEDDGQLIEGEEKPDESKKQSSLVIIFSVWKTMIGTAVVSLPWAYQQSGFVLGLIITLMSFLISFYTCKLIVDSSMNDKDYSLTLKKYYGKTVSLSFK